MASTKLDRKALRNVSRQVNRKKTIKHLTAKPTLKNVDLEELKAQFPNAKKAAPAKKAEPKADAAAPEAAAE